MRAKRPGMIDSCRASNNPFNAQRTDSLNYRLVDTTWDLLVERLRGSSFRGAIVGPHGSGKTTFIESLSRRLGEEGLPLVSVFLNADCPHPWQRVRTALGDRLSPSTILCIDGAEQLGRWRWRQTMRRTRGIGGLIITSHTEGRLPTVLTTRTSVVILRELVEQLAPHDLPKLDPILPALYARHHGNIRLCLQELYDIYAGRK